MISTIDNYMTFENFAKQYTTKTGKQGVSRQYIYQLLQREREEPNSTELDFLQIDNSYFCRYRIAPPAGKQKVATARPQKHSNTRTVLA